VRSPSSAQVEHRAQRAADQALDLLGAAALLAARRLAVAAGVAGARQHAVLGSHPALRRCHAGAAAPSPPREAVHSTSVAPNSISTEPSACTRVGAGDAHRAQRIGGHGAAADRSGHGALLSSTERRAWVGVGRLRGTRPRRHAGQSSAVCVRSAADGLVDLGNRALDSGIVEVVCGGIAPQPACTVEANTPSSSCRPKTPLRLRVAWRRALPTHRHQP